jgi:hypothetical protein
MLDPWIIEEIVRREREEKSRHEERRIDIPLDNPPRYHDSEPKPPVPKDEGERGVVTIDI